MEKYKKSFDFHGRTITVENGEIAKVRKIGSPKPVEEYLKMQSRFKHLFAKEGKDAEIAKLRKQLEVQK